MKKFKGDKAEEKAEMKAGWSKARMAKDEKAERKGKKAFVPFKKK